MKCSVGFAAGLALLVVASTASAQQGGGRGGRGFGPATNSMLLGMEQVRAEIGVKDDQTQKIEDVVAEVREKLTVDFQGFRDLSDDERDKRMAEFRKKSEEVNKEADARFAKILDEKQMARLAELRLQRDGASALARPEVAEKVGLSKEQQDKIAKLQEGVRTGGFEGFRERREKADADTLALLNAEQKTKWTQLQGKAFTFPQRGGGNRQQN